jgi:hypothetical protein
MRSTDHRSPSSHAVLRRRAALIAATVALAVPVAAGPALATGGGDHDGGGGDNGNGNAYGHDKDKDKDKSAESAPPTGAPAPAAPAPAPAPSGGDKSKGHDKPKGGREKSHDKPSGGVKGESAEKPAPSTAPSTAGKSKSHSKVTLCHSTGSSTNPYVLITVSENAVKAHARHHDGRDIIPAPAGGCPGGDTAPATGGKEHGKKEHGKKEHGKKEHGKVTLCHSTNSATNPYVVITVSENAVKAHARHHDGRDIIPAPAGGCPTTAAAAPGTTTPGAKTPDGGAPAAGGPATGVAPGVTGPIVNVLETVGVPASAVPGVAGAVLGAFATQPAEQTPGTVAGAESAPAGAVLGEMDEQAPASVAPATATRENGANGGSLPFTGLELWLVVAAGLALLLAGVAARRAQSRGTDA